MGRSVDVHKQQAWLARFQRFEKSRLTVARFCQQEHVSVPAFYKWRKKLAAKSSSQQNQSCAPPAPSANLPTNLPPDSFLPVQLLPATCCQQPAHVEVRLTNGVCLRLPSGDGETLRQTIHVVSQLPADLARGDETEDAEC
jgi:hypothetical protein